MATFKMEMISTKEQARQKAIDWQNWQSEQVLSYKDLIFWQGYFENLSWEFDLQDEFKENGII